MIGRSFSCISWNVRGLGDEDKCGKILTELISQRPALVALQETKLSAISTSKSASFLHSRLKHYAHFPAIGASGGILSAWDQSTFSLVSVEHRRFSLTCVLSFLADGSSFVFTNIYAPANHADKEAFLLELSNSSPTDSTPWLLLGDFNLTRTPEDKNNSNFHATEANLFNETLHALGLIELPLLDRAYTWSNKREIPTLVRLDRAFINLSWDEHYPNSTLLSLTRFTSDHVPLKLTVSTTIPRSQLFRFENSWLVSPLFRQAMVDTVRGPPPNQAQPSFMRHLKKCRRSCRLWAKRRGPIQQRESDTKTLVTALDLLEECRPLTSAELALRRVGADALNMIAKEKLSIWRQRFSIKVVIQGDENTRFFHASATQRRRKNYISMLESDGHEHTSHDSKATILHDFYHSLLGSPLPSAWNFSLSTLYPTFSIDGEALSTPFTRDEIRSALFAMDANASPGPDGFGPSFYKAFWSELEPRVLTLFDQFYRDAADLDALNRAFLVLLPKKSDARTADAFRPISLQNCPMKMFAKVLANRLRPCIPSLVDPDQTGFVHGRSIAENYVYAADLLSCCHRRCTPTAVLKLDFRKAFDSICWDSLDNILSARGFDERWRSWINNILQTGKTAVLLNGVPGNWIQCRRGLRQGDPLSPFLFIIVADVLQRLISQASRNGLLAHPVDDSLPCPVLQYADDTLILVRGDVQTITALKQVLDSFSAATGLVINFHKSTFVPMNVDELVSIQMANILGCPVSTFPQTYLGLPLSPTRLLMSDYAPLLASFDRYLAGWKARLLSVGGRLVLTNAVLGSLAVYFMSSLPLPVTVREALDARRRAFLWTGTETCSGAQCLIAWDKVRLPREEGGLGVKDLSTQNHCLLMKFVHRFLGSDDPPWKRWVQHNLTRCLGDRRPNSYLARLIHDELPRYRSITSVLIGDGKTTSFWMDHWTGSAPLYEVFPSLFSHSTDPHCSLLSVLSVGIRLQNRLTLAARRELSSLQTILNSVQLSATADQRVILTQPPTTYSSRKAYMLLHHTGVRDEGACVIWSTNLPSRVKVFSWLLYNSRLQTRANLYHKNIRAREESNCQRCPAILETDTHLFLSCPAAAAFWNKLHLCVDEHELRTPWLTSPPDALPTSVWPDIILLLLRQVWLSRNALIFDGRDIDATSTLREAIKNMETWKYRYKRKRPAVEVWVNYFKSKIVTVFSAPLPPLYLPPSVCRGLLYCASRAFSNE
ncbi:unnamed protein product [Urochloa humidicola]